MCPRAHYSLAPLSEMLRKGYEPHSVYISWRGATEHTEERSTQQYSSRVPTILYRTSLPRVVVLTPLHLTENV